MNPLDPLLNSVPPSQRNMTEALLRNQMKHLYNLDGPYFCDGYGEYVSVEDVSNPKYIPHVRFQNKIAQDPKVDISTNKHGIYIYRPDTDELFDYEWDPIAANESLPYLVKIEERQVYHEKLLERIRTFDIGIWKGNEFAKWMAPLMRKTFPKISAQQLVSVQPMTSPISLIFYSKYQYGNGGNSAGS